MFRMDKLNNYNYEGAEHRNIFGKLGLILRCAAPNPNKICFLLQILCGSAALVQ